MSTRSLVLVLIVLVVAAIVGGAVFALVVWEDLSSKIGRLDHISHQPVEESAIPYRETSR